MKEKELEFDRARHICYSDKVKAEIMSYLSSHYDEALVPTLWEKIQRQYVEYLSDLPYLGGKKCTHNGPGGTYDCIAIFAMYTALDGAPTIDEMYNMNNAVFLPPFRRMGKLLNVNKGWIRRLMSKIFTTVAKRDKKWEATCPTGYIMEVEPYDEELGIRYKFHRCPIAEFAKAHNLTHIMPAFCNGDYPAMQAIHGDLIREHTCSNSDYCDYWIVGSDSHHLADHPLITDEVGYMRNVTKTDEADKTE